MGNNVSAPVVSPAPVPNSNPTTTLLQSRRSSIASGTSSVDSASSAEKGLPPQTTATSSSSSSSTCSQVDPAYPVDPLSRTFPEPTEDVDVAEMLERKPLKWTLGHYIKTPTREPSDPFDDKEKVALDMEARKRELLAAKEEMQRLARGP